MATVASLTADFGVPGRVSFELLHGLVVARLRLGTVATAVVALHGGHIVSFVDHTGTDTLYLRCAQRGPLMTLRTNALLTVSKCDHSALRRHHHELITMSW